MHRLTVACTTTAWQAWQSPCAAQPGAARREFEHRRAFRDKIKWRTGYEGRINHLKRSYGWNRTELTGIHGARTWCGHGVFAHNLVKISALSAGPGMTIRPATIVNPTRPGLSPPTPFRY